MYNSKRFDNQKTVTVQKGTTIAFVTKSGTKMGEHRIRRVGDDKIAIAYSLIPATAKSLSKKTHSVSGDDRRAYYILDLGTFCPHIHRADTCDAPCSYQKNTNKKVLAFAGDSDGVEVTVSTNGDKNLRFTPKPADEDADVMAFAVDLGKTIMDNVQKVQLVTLR